jgi:putative nucleotidyltransferase with HDIG domain
MNRESALELLKKYTASESLIKHALAVEAGMRGYAEKFGEDVECWGITGLLHDVDYEMYPEVHGVKGAEILKDNGYPEEIYTAVREHAEDKIEKSSKLSQTLYAVDELSSFVVACALVRPNKDLDGIELKSVKKKFKTLAFTKGVNREIVEKGAQGLHIELEQHMLNVIEALCGREKELASTGVSLTK